MRKLNVVRSHEHEIFTETIKHWIAANDHVKAQEEQNFADSDQAFKLRNKANNKDLEPQFSDFYKPNTQ